jgi:DNA gyrase subunit A
VAEAEQVQSMLVVGEGDVLTATENGFGKRTAIGEFPVKGRGGMGVIGIQTSERNGALVGALQVTEEDDIMLISDGGTLVRMGAWDVSSVGRNTQGVTLIRLSEQETLVGLAKILSEADEEGEEEGGDEE